MANGGTDSNGNKTSDGQWHMYEVHLKTDTNGSNGIAEMWIDGVKRLSYSNAYFGSAGFDGILIGSNSRDPLNGRCMAVDYDDIAISNTGPIGPITGGGDAQAPSVPIGLSAQVISSSQINLSWTVSTDNTGVTGYRIYRCQGTGCVPSIQIATSATNSYSNIGLTASTVYTYRVAAYDAAGNVSGQSSSATATTQAIADTTPPASPTGLTVQ
ncbi:MAG: fibronectin type III domain-containing protein [Patescibacteria group bacterium]